MKLSINQFRFITLALFVATFGLAMTSFAPFAIIPAYAWGWLSCTIDHRLASERAALREQEGK